MNFIIPGDFIFQILPLAKERSALPKIVLTGNQILTFKHFLSRGELHRDSASGSEPGGGRPMAFVPPSQFLDPLTFFWRFL